MSTPLNGSILKAFDILRLVTPERPELTAGVLKDELGMSFATAHRFLATLEEAGALVAVRRGVWQLGLGAAEIGRIAELTNPYAPRVQPLIDRLCAEVNESVMVCRLTRAGPTCAAVAIAGRPITVSIGVGTTLSFFGAAQGRLWLAAMDSDERARLCAGAGVDADAVERDVAQVRRQGYAVNSGDAEPDIGAVAAPIRDARGATVLTLSVFGPLTRFTPETLPLLRDKVLAAAARIERDVRQ